MCFAASESDERWATLPVAGVRVSVQRYTSSFFFCFILKGFALESRGGLEGEG